MAPKCHRNHLEQPYEICDLASFKALNRCRVSGYVRITNDLDFSTETNFQPMFLGFGVRELDGGNKILSNLKISPSAGEWGSVGLFSSVERPTLIKNLILHVTIEGSVPDRATQIGGLSGAFNGKLEDSTIFSTIHLTGKRSFTIGGAIGDGQPEIRRVSVVADISTDCKECSVGGVLGSGGGSMSDVANFHENNRTKIVALQASQVGGIAGMITLQDSATDEIKSEAEIECGSYCGGVFGVLEGSLSGARATTHIKASGPIVGGLVGMTRAVVSNSYAKMQIDAPKGSFVGGLIGLGTETSRIEYSYFTGRVPICISCGTIAGWDEKLAMKSTYWDAGPFEKLTPLDPTARSRKRMMYRILGSGL